MRVLITNTVALNGGDAAILEGLLKVARAAFGEDLEVLVYDSQPEVASRYYPALRFRKLLYLGGGWTLRLPGIGHLLRRLRARALLAAAKRRRRMGARAKAWFLTREDREDLEAYANADLVISTGGTYLVENYDLTPRIFDYRFIRALGRPYLFFSQSLGPFRSERNRVALKPIFEQAAAVMVRDQRSRRHLLELGLAEANLIVSADAAFALADRAAVETARDATHTPGSALRVAISVRDWRHFRSVSAESGMRALRDAVGFLARHLVEKHGAEVCFLSTCQGVPEYWADDSKVAGEIVAQLPERVRDKVRVDAAFRSPETLRRELGSWDVVVAMRMHMAVLALCAGTPVFPVAYEFKTRELFERLGAGEFVQDVESMRGEELAGRFDAFLDRMPGLRGRLFDKVLEQHEEAMGSARILADTRS
ncbi:MAG: polysaccharide pyruvyl transferase family protein [Planctomycetota bacterium]|jgi:colanic acid/amylovoran biosynthesis protein